MPSSLDIRISALCALGLDIRQMLEPGNPAAQKLYREAHIRNGWFTPENCRSALEGIAAWLTEEKLREWISPYQKKIETHASKKIGIIAAGNIPGVGFHDFLTVFLTGNYACLKLSSDDTVLMEFLLGELKSYLPEKENWEITPKLPPDSLQGIIATGSNNSARYFEYYFGKLPHLFRKNRKSVAVLEGNENEEELQGLGKDIFTYFGLGCRNVSKLFVPEGYNFDAFFNGIFPFSDVVLNKKYGNNYDYNRAIFLMNGTPLLDNNFVLLTESSSLHPPVAMVYYEYYKSPEDLQKMLVSAKDQIQCIDGNRSHDFIPFGKTQQPTLSDYADGINTPEFCLGF